MGYSNWSDKAFKSRQSHRRQTNTSAFTYDQQVRQNGDWTVHPDMNPFGQVRESRDSAEHPESVAIGVLFDVTGSMGGVPRVLQTKLGALMRTLIQKGYVAHPQVLFGAVGDAFTDRVPLQIGQFESGLEMDDDLGKLVLEGGGGGQMHESYELGVYFFAHHTAIDCYEKRGKKGYLFTIGDEKPYDLDRRQVAQLIGDPSQQATQGESKRKGAGKKQKAIPMHRLVKDVQQRYEYFHIIPTNTAYAGNTEIRRRWQDLLGERVLMLDDETAVCETIALAIALCEGTVNSLDEATDEMIGSGHAASAVGSASTALRPFAQKHPVVARAQLALASLPAQREDGWI